MIFGDPEARTLPPDDFPDRVKNLGPPKNAARKKSVDIKTDTEKKSNVEAATKFSGKVPGTPKNVEKDESPNSRQSLVVQLDDVGHRPEVEVYPKPGSSKKKSFDARKGSAFEFVRQLRRESLANPTPVVAKTREQEISEIGISMQQRVVETATGSIIALPKNRPMAVVGKLDRWLRHNMGPLAS